MMKYFISSFFG